MSHTLFIKLSLLLIHPDGAHPIEHFICGL